MKNFSTRYFTKCLMLTALVIGCLSFTANVSMAQCTTVQNVNTGETFCTIQAAINAPNTLNGHTIVVAAGTYEESISIAKSLTLKGAQADNCATTRSGAETIINCVNGIGVNASNVVINGFTIQGQTSDTLAPGFGYAVYMSPPFTGTHLVNNIIKNNMKGASLSNAGASPTQVLISCNWFDANNNRINDTTAVSPAGQGIYTDESVSGGPVSQVMIDGNRFTNQFDAGVTFFNHVASNASSNITIIHNDFDGNGRAAFLSRVNNSIFSSNLAHNSTLATSSDLRLFGGVNNLTATNNSFIASGNVHAVRISGGQGTNSNVLLNQNSFVGYAADTAVWIISGYAGTLNAHCNWWNTISNPAIAAQVVGAVDYMPWLSNGTDNSPAIGFQPAPNSCNGCPSGLITNVNTGMQYCTFQAAINDPATLNGHVITAPAGTYNESFSITKSVTLKGAQAGNCAITRSASETIINCINGIGINASNVVINGFTIQGQTTDSIAPGFGFGVYMAPPSTGTQLINNIIKNNMKGASLSNAGASPAAVLISCNWFDSNNNPPDSTSASPSGEGIFTDETVSGGPVSQVTIDGNRFTNQFDAGVTFFNRVASNVSSGISITHNDFDGNGRAAFLSRVNNSIFSSNLAHNSTLATSSDLRLFGGVNNLTATNNIFIASGNVHAVRISGGQGTNSNVLLNENSFVGYAADTAVWIISGYTGTLNAHCNWWNTTLNAAIAVQVVGAVDYMPWLSNGTDNSPSIGFQPAPNSCNGCPSGLITNVNTGMQYCTFQAAINDPATLNGHVITAPAGTYNESFSITKSVVLKGAEADICAATRSGAETIINCVNGIGVNANNIIINGFTIQGQTTDSIAPGFGAAVRMSAPFTGTHLVNNIIKNNMKGVSVSNAGASPTPVLISCNWFDSNNNQPDSTSASPFGHGVFTDETVSGGPVSQVIIDNNKFSGHADAGVTFFNRVASNVSTGITITNNEFDGNGRAAFLSRVNNSTFSSNLCHNSTLATSADLRLFGGVNNLTAMNNSFVEAGNDVHAVRISGGQGNNSNVLLNENSFVGYAADTAVWIISGYAGTLNAHCNWWNTISNPAIAAQVVGAVDYMPWLSNGTDNSPAIGFQPVPNSCNGCPSGLITNVNTGMQYCTFQAAINDPATLNGHVITAPAGTYNESFSITKSVVLKGAEADICAATRSGAETIINCVNGIGVNANNIIINGFTIQGQTADSIAPGFGVAVRMSPPYTGTHLINNIIKNNMKGVTVSNAGASPTPVLISCNWFDSNNNPPDSTSASPSGEGIFTDETVSGGPVSQVTIDGNRFTNQFDAGVTFFNRVASNVSSGISITHNDFDGNGRAAFLSRVNNSIFSSNLCHNSTLATSSDLRLFGGVNNLTAMNNSFVEAGNDVHAVRISGGQGTNSNVLLNENSFVGYAADTAVWIISGYTGTLNAHCNWWNTISNPAIAGQVVGAVDYMPWLSNGTDNSPAIGFQPVPNSCNGCPSGIITNNNTGMIYCTIQAAINDPATLNGHTINVPAGTYNESVNITKSVTLKGAQFGVCAISRSGPESIINCVNGIGINASNVTINGFTIQGQTNIAAPGKGFGVYMAPGSNGTNLLDNIIKNNMKGASVSNLGSSPSAVVISCNWFDSNNNPDTTTTVNSGEGIYTDDTTSGGPTSNISITGNRFTNHADAGVNFFTQQAANASTTVTIINNDFDGNGRAAFLANMRGPTFSNNLCHNSTLSTSADLRLFGGINGMIAKNNSFIESGHDVHAVRISGGFGANSNVLLNENSFVGYAADTAVWIISGYTGTLNAHCNWWNTISNSVIAGQVVGAVDYTPWLTNGTDNSPAIGFQPVPNSCNGLPTPVLTVTINGNTLTANNDGNDETKSMVVCNIPNNMTFSAISDLANISPSSQVKIRQEFIATNSTVCCPNGDFPISVYGGTFQRSANLIAMGISGQLIIRLRAYFDANNNNIADPGEAAGDWLIFTVNIDGKAPTLTIPANANVECNQVPAVGIASVTDDLDPNPTVSYLGETRTNGNCPNNYTLTRTWRATDACGNTTTASQTINVSDHTAPTITCPPSVTVQCASAVPPPAPTTVTASDNCSAVTVSWVTDIISNQTCANHYTITRIYIAVDACGNSAICTQTITVNDNTPPTISCPASVMVQCASAVPPPATASVTASDNCGAVTVTWGGDVVSDSTCKNKYKITRTYRATDACGNTVTCTQTITVRDDTPPTITCPAAVIVQCASAVPPPATASVIASDNCGAVTVTWGGDVITNQICANKYTITRTYRATDACGNTAICTQTITVRDETPPTITCPASMTVQCASAVPAPAPATVTASDNCGAVTVTWGGDVITNQICANKYTITRTYRATDACGNTATCNQTITVRDETPPTIACPVAAVVQCASAVPAPSPSTVTASDNCGAVTVTWTGDVVSDSTCINKYKITRTYKAMDACGNSASCTQIITVNDNTPPVITCPPAITVQCASAVPTVNTNAVTATDNCGDVVKSWVSDVISNQTCSNKYTITRTYKATDRCGNSSICTQIITVFDNIAPTFTCPANKTIPFTGTCIYNANPTNTGSPTNVTDNCVGTVAVTYTDVVSQCGYNTVITRTWKATDICGNSSTCTQTITVTDNNTSYIIYATLTAKFGESNTINGDVGVTDANGKADFKKNDVLDPNHVYAKNITVQLPAMVNNKHFIPATGGPNPAFMIYSGTGGVGSFTQSVNGTVTGNYNNLTIKKNVVATVTGNDFGHIMIEEGADVTFTSGTINVQQLDIKKGKKNTTTTKVQFAGCTAVMVSDEVTVEDDCNVNVGGPKVIFYMGDNNSDPENFNVTGNNSQVTANIIIPHGDLHVTGGADGTKMTGWFITETLTSDGPNITWNKYGCASTAAKTAEPVFTQVTTAPLVAAPQEILQVKVYPNPSSTDFSLQVMSSSNDPISVRIMDINGIVLKVNTTVLKGSVVRLGSELRGGTYFAEVRQGANKQVVKLVKLN